MDMTAITTPWGLLDDDTREIMVSLADTEAFEVYAGRYGWITIDAAPLWNEASVYRVRPARPEDK